MSQKRQSAAQRAYQQLLTGQQSLMLATINEDGSPRVTYSPFIVTEEKLFYIFVSGLAAHTGNLLRNQQASVMLIEDEASAQQVFARQRLSFQCEATPIERNSAEWQTALGQYQARFGEMARTVSALPDFQLFRLRPVAGQLVLGFGQAYQLGGDNWETLSHRRT